MKKKNIKTISFLTLISAAFLSGCTTNAIPDLPEDEMKQVEEYAAGLLLEKATDHKSTLVSDEEIADALEDAKHKAELRKQAEEMRRQEQEAKENKQDKEDKDGNGSSDPVAATPVYTDIDDFLGIDDLEIEYSGYDICEQYPEQTESDDWQGVAKATAGCKFAVFKFKVNNPSDEPVYFDMASIDAHFGFRFNDQVSKSALTTLLLNDLAMFRGEIPSGDTELVLLSEMTAAEAENLQSAVLIMRLDDQRSENTLFSSQ
ncbi:MAG: hypothetical protein K6C99_01485 [Lachnospiraceae bacterium]|nr:hypothetical protein [Lachnospiraceae bacterium]